MNQPEPALLPGLRRPDRGHASTYRERAMHKSSQKDKQEHDIHEVILHDNSYGGTRGFDGELPFCYGEPLVLRKIEDLGISFEEHEDGSISIEFGGTVGEGEDGAVPCKVESAHRLCVPCKDTISNFLKCLTRAQKSKESLDPDGGSRHPLWDMKKNVLLHPSLMHLYATSHINKTLCYLCILLWDKIEDLFPKLGTSTYKDYRIEACWRLNPEREADGEPRIWFFMVNSTVEKEGLYNWQLLHKLSFWSQETHGKYFDKRVNAVSVIPIRGSWDDCADDGSNNGLPSRQLALAWLQKCKDNEDGQHDLCNRQDSGFLPTRLIDVPYALEHGKVRLVCSKDKPERFVDSADKLYATLSHCWGKWGSENNPNLLSTNIDERVSAGLDFDSLPATFKDALKIASWFGWTWLWIDSLCIIQDSKSDWVSEAAIMDKVYHNSQINISADLGDDSRSGCFTQPGDLIDYPLAIGLEGCEDKWHLTGNQEFRWMQFATSFSRAWIHRERQLSRRILHCTSEEFVWECCGLGKSGFASQAMPGGAPFETIFNKEVKFQVKWQQALESKPREASTAAGDQNEVAQGQEPQRTDSQIKRIGISNERGETGESTECEGPEKGDVIEFEEARHLDKVYDLWNTTCQDLSNKSVTFLTDMPIILSSLAREFQEMIPDDEYVCGHWRSTLPESLSWFTRQPRKVNSLYVAPSWSWLSLSNPVQLPIRSRFKHNLPVAEVLDIDCDYATDDKYGQVTKGELKMLGYARRLHFYFLGNGHFVISVIEKSDLDKEERIRIIGPDWNPTDGLTCQLTTDKTLSLDGQEWECTALFTVISEKGQDLASCKRKLSCVLLEEIGHETPRAVAVPPLFHELTQLLQGPNGPPSSVITMTREEMLKISDEDPESDEDHRNDREEAVADVTKNEEPTPTGEERGEDIEKPRQCGTVDATRVDMDTLDGENTNSRNGRSKAETDKTEPDLSAADSDEPAKKKKEPKRYRKVGALNNLCDEYAFKLRYTVYSFEDDEVKGKYRSEFVNNPSDYEGPTIDQRLRSDEDEAPLSGISDDIWDNLAEFIAHNRWEVLYQAEADAKAKKKDRHDGEEEVEEEEQIAGKEEDFKISRREGVVESEEDGESPDGVDSTKTARPTTPLDPEGQKDEGPISHDHIGFREPLSGSGVDTNTIKTPAETVPEPPPMDKNEDSRPSSVEGKSTAPDAPNTIDSDNYSIWRQSLPPMLQIFIAVWHHPCGLERRIKGNKGVVDSAKEFMALDSVHPAHGKQMGVEDALYQFDQVLWDWMEAQKVCQWLVALDPEELIIV